MTDEEFGCLELAQGWRGGARMTKKERKDDEVRGKDDEMGGKDDEKRARDVVVE